MHQDDGTTPPSTGIPPPTRSTPAPAPAASGSAREAGAADPATHIEALRARVDELESQFLRAHRLATLGTLAASIAHEVNNLLTPILSYAQLALAAPQDADLTRKALERAADCAEKASRIGSAMLGFARADEPVIGLGDSRGPVQEAGCAGVSAQGPRAQETRFSADIAAVVADALACLGRDPRKDGIELCVDVPTGLRAGIAPVALQQVVLNLALNAREAMRGRSASSLRISARRVGSTGNVELSVADSGPGLPSGVLSNLFTPFVRSEPARGSCVQANADQIESRATREDVVPTRAGDDRADAGVAARGPGFAEAFTGTGSELIGGGASAESPRRVGSGLGLAVTHTLITRAGGTIRVESHAGVGTTFFIVLPTAAGEELAASTAGARGEAARGRGAGLGGQGRRAA